MGTRGIKCGVYTSTITTKVKKFFLYNNTSLELVERYRCIKLNIHKILKSDFKITKQVTGKIIRTYLKYYSINYRMKSHKISPMQIYIYIYIYCSINVNASRAHVNLLF